MYLQYASSILASEQLALGRVPFGGRYQGQTLVDAFAPFRADFSTVYARGRGPREFSIGVWRFHTTEAEALDFVLTHEDTVPQQDDLTIVDEAEGSAWLMADAVCTARILERRGVAVLVEYVFTGSRFTSDSVPAAPTDTDTVKSKVVNLTAGETSKAVAYDAAFGAAPRFVSAQLSIPDGGQAFGIYVRESTRTASGVTFDFDGAVPASGTYKLLVFAAL